MAKATAAQLSRREIAAWRGLLRTHALVLAELDAELEQAPRAGGTRVRGATRAQRERRQASAHERAGRRRAAHAQRYDASRRPARAAGSRAPRTLPGRWPRHLRGDHAEGAARFAAARPTHIAGVRRLFLDPLKKKDQRALGRPSTPCSRAHSVVIYPRARMRPSPELAGGHTPMQVALARVRISAGPRACELAALGRSRWSRSWRSRRSRCGTPSRMPTTRTLLRPVRGLPARPPRTRRLPLWNPFAFSGHRSLDPQSGVHLTARSWPTGCSRPRLGWSCSSRSTTCSRRSLYTLFARLVGAGLRRGLRRARLRRVGLPAGAREALGLLTGAAWLAQRYRGAVRRPP